MRKIFFASSFFYVWGVTALLPSACTSNTADTSRNQEIFSEARSLQIADFTSSAYNFDGGIAGLITIINALGASSGSDSMIADTTIEGIVSLPSSYAIGLGSNGCSVSNTVYQRAFVLEDMNSAVLVAYGLEPPLQDVGQANSMKYIANARQANMAVFGDRLRLTVTRAVKYGSANTIPIVTDFKDVQLLSQRNSVSYANKASAFARTLDLYKTRRIEGYVTQAPAYAECASGSARQYQFNYQTGYLGKLCVGASSYSDALTCSGSKVELKFQLSYNLGAGTLSGFDTGDSFSYNFGVGAKVRLTGPIFVSEYDGNDTKLLMMLGQRIQAETLR